MISSSQKGVLNQPETPQKRHNEVSSEMSEKLTIKIHNLIIMIFLQSGKENNENNEPSDETSMTKEERQNKIKEEMGADVLAAIQQEEKEYQCSKCKNNDKKK